MEKDMKKGLVVINLLISLTFLYGQSTITCMQCHEGSPVEQEKYRLSVHGSLECVDCHADVQLNDDMEHINTPQPVQCSNCHSDVQETFDQFGHGKVFFEAYIGTNGQHEFPTCVSCHDPHTMLPSDNEQSLLNKKNQHLMCNNCHTRDVEEIKGGPVARDVVDDYLKSYHYEVLREGYPAATCSDCHGSHEITLTRDPKSRVNEYNLDKTCSSCHQSEGEEYTQGIHAYALKAGVKGAPTCNDCHDSHSIYPPSDPRSPLHPANAGHYACVVCHNNERLVKKYGLKRDRVSSYEDSYHGLAAKRGSENVAYCQDCHGSHAILPASNPASMISDENLLKTCHKCHPEATMEFARSYTHNALLIEKSPVNKWIKRIYLVLIAGFLAFTFFHIGVVWYHYIREKVKKIDSDPVIRMTLAERIQHTLLFLSFFTLVITGFALKFPDADWVHLLRSILGTTEETRSLIHRIAAVVLIADSLFHIVYVAFTPRGRRLFRAFIPGFKDMVDMIENFKYYLGLRKTQPEFGKFDYAEKIEYWALIWGTIVMVITGFVLWFPTFFTGFLPSWVIRAAELIHYFEAWLATLSIFFYHFFFVIFHPEEYPMNLAWITGKMHRKHYEEKHPADKDWTVE